MIDWHSHILPQMDDGSKSIEESVTLLSMLSAQGADTVIATPHFYANDESVERFLERRVECYDRLRSVLPDGKPEILLGAEVSYYFGISRLEELSMLCVEGTNLLLLEMPFTSWSDSVIRDIIEIATQRSVTVILAHIERYIDMQSGSTFDELRAHGVIMQVNASFFRRRATRRKALRLLKKRQIALVGSDTHNIKSRPPALDEAYDIIERKFGNAFVNEINEYGYFLLDNKYINNKI